jgi:hypothetical protein
MEEINKESNEVLVKTLNRMSSSPSAHHVYLNQSNSYQDREEGDDGKTTKKLNKNLTGIRISITFFFGVTKIKDICSSILSH